MKKSGLIKAAVFLAGAAVAAKLAYDKLKPQKEEIYEDIFEEEELFTPQKKEACDIQVIMAENREIRLSGELQPQNYKLIGDSVCFDLSDATVSEEVTMKLFSLVSSVTVKAPGGVSVKLNGKHILGGKEGAPVLYIEAVNILSTLKVH